jgi:predicted transcriptional regulator of viral defense system
MKTIDAIRELSSHTLKERFVYQTHDLRKVFREDGRAFTGTLSRLTAEKILTRVTRGVYVFSLSNRHGHNLLEHIANTIRRGEYNYLSLEAALSEYGAISQVPIDRLTVMTTGRSGEFKTPYGTIEFTHTSRSIKSIIAGCKNVDTPLLMATLKTATRDLNRIGRNTHLLEINNE